MSARPWFREPMLALVIGIPLASVVAGVATLVIAAGGPGDAMDADVRRVAQVQTADLAPDRESARLGLEATAALDGTGAIDVQFLAGTAPVADSLILALRHGTDAERDLVATLTRTDGDRYLGRLPAPRAAGAYNATLQPAGADWRLVGRLAIGGERIELRPALADGHERPGG